MNKEKYGKLDNYQYKISEFVYHFTFNAAISAREPIIAGTRSIIVAGSLTTTCCSRITSYNRE